MAKLDAKKRNALPSSTFAEPKERKFPINDESHARNALARSSGKPAHAAVVKKVRAKYPGIKIGGKGGGSKKRRGTSDGYMNS